MAALTGDLAALETEGIVAVWKADGSGRLIAASGPLAHLVEGGPLQLLSVEPLPGGLAVRATSAMTLREAVDNRRAFADVRLLVPDGGAGPRVFSLCGVPTADETGRHTGFTGLATDVTAAALAGETAADRAALMFVNRRLDHTARELAHRTDQLTLAQQIARIGHWTVHVREDTITLSAEAGRLLNLPDDTPLPRAAVMGCFATEDVQAHLAKREHLLKTGAPFEMETLAHPPGRMPLWVRLSLWPIRGSGEGIDSVFGTIQDIDDRKQAELRLAESQEQLAEAQRIARLGYFRSDLKAGIVHWSDLLVEMTGASAGTLTHDEADRLFDPQGWAEFCRRRQRSLATGEPFTGRMRAARRDRWITYRGVPRFDDEGVAVAVFGVVQDISEQVRLEQERDRADAFLRNLVEHASISITVKDLSGRILLANAEVRRLLGMDSADVVGEPLDSMLTKAGAPERARMIAAEDEAVLAAGHPMEFTYRLATPDGTERDFHAVTFPIRDDAGTVIAIGSLRSDITELKKAQRALEAANERLEAEVEARTAALRASEERFRDIASSASDWFFETDRSRRITAYSEGFERATGLLAETLVGRTFDDTRPDPAVVGEEELAGWERVRDLMTSGRPLRDVEYWRRDAGGHRYLRMSARPLFEGGVFVGYRGCASDITALTDARRRLAEADRLASLGRLVAGVAHELNTPIGSSLTVATTLRGAVDPLLKRYREDAMTEEAFLEFVDRVRTGAGLIAGSLTQAGELVRRFKQVSVDQTSHLRRRFDLSELVDNNLAALLPSIGPSAVTVRNAVPRDIWLDSYPGPLGQTLVNLVQNAFAHAFEGRGDGTIRVSATSMGDDAVRIAIADDGVGMTEEVRKRLFEPFFTTRLGRGGSGLGMNIVYNIVTRVLGGTIRVDDTAPEGGTTLLIDVPRTAP